ncbi:hypothetical protein SG34_018645 [Thalassomonas viridans]|uniref:PepSY domain-containing protein n=1 Tax=Thalassomonas viridans TaxID=137584 RepID=A0AAF0C7J4_9GAMM|nr:DUF6488 family protein [Thalassomonas viridans]WDE03406.1 hypothetical protein SG34_018645 [Thalassomonas viridans]
MKTFVKFIMVATFALSAAVQAHTGGHGQISAGKAVTIAQTSAKMLTFKDHGMSVGKIDKSWEKVAKENFTLVEKGAGAYIVKGVNPASHQTLYFTISKQGQVIEVAEPASFKSDHGHAH